MVCRLVEDQQLRRRRAAEDAGEARAQALAAAKRGDLLQRGACPEPETRERGPAGIFLRLRIEAAEVFEDRLGRLQQAHVLVEHHIGNGNACLACERRERCR